MRIRALFVSIAVLASLLLNGAPQAEAVVDANINPASPCKDLMIVGARGSGEEANAAEWGLGPVLYPIVAELTSRLEPHRQVGVDWVNYPAQNVNTISLVLGGDWTFFNGLDDGVQDATRFLRDRARRCPSEHYVLAGYSQGAMVINRAARLLDVEKLAERIDGVLLVADGDRVPKDGSKHLGTSAEAKQDYGIGFEFGPSISGTATTKPPSLFLRAGVWYEVCNTLDAVCDFGRVLANVSNLVPAVAAARLAVGLNVHVHSYSPATARTAVAEIARRVERQPLASISLSDRKGYIARPFQAGVKLSPA